MLNIILGKCVICYVCVSIIFLTIYLFFVVFHYNLQDKHLVFNHEIVFVFVYMVICFAITLKVCSCFDLSFC